STSSATCPARKTGVPLFLTAWEYPCGFETPVGLTICFDMVGNFLRAHDAHRQRGQLLSTIRCPQRAEFLQDRLTPRMLGGVALDHLRPEPHVCLVRGSGLERHDHVTGPVDDVAPRHVRPVAADERPAAELGQDGREIADVRRLILLDVTDEGRRLGVTYEK